MIMEKYHTKTFTKIALAFLVASIGASFGNLMQVPTASASSNAAILSQLITQFNNCDESGLGSSSAVCSNTALNRISGPLTVGSG